MNQVQKYEWDPKVADSAVSNSTGEHWTRCIVAGITVTVSGRQERIACKTGYGTDRRRCDCGDRWRPVASGYSPQI